MKKFNELNLANAVGIVSALSMLVITVLGKAGFYSGAMESMMRWHMFYNTSFVGLIGGMIEAFIIGFIFTYAVALFYNKLNK